MLAEVKNLTKGYLRQQSELHWDDSDDSDSSESHPFRWSQGLLQVLVLILLPPPQLLLHEDQLVQEFQFGTSFKWQFIIFWDILKILTFKFTCLLANSWTCHTPTFCYWVIASTVPGWLAFVVVTPRSPWAPSSSDSWKKVLSNFGKRRI